MTKLRSALQTLNTQQGAKVLLYCDLRGIQRDLAVRGAWGMAMLGLAMLVLRSFARSDSLLAPFLNWMGIGVCCVGILYGCISLCMIWVIRSTKHSLREIGVGTELIELLDALPSKGLARRSFGG